MYITENIIGTSLLENIIYKEEKTGPLMIQAMMLNPSVKKEIIAWTKDSNVNIDVLVYYDAISNSPIQIRLEEFSYSVWMSYDRALLRFDSVEDYNLFKLTWG